MINLSWYDKDDMSTAVAGIVNASSGSHINEPMMHVMVVRKEQDDQWAGYIVRIAVTGSYAPQPEFVIRSASKTFVTEAVVSRCMRYGVVQDSYFADVDWRHIAFGSGVVPEGLFASDVSADKVSSVGEAFDLSVFNKVKEVFNGF